MRRTFATACAMAAGLCLVPASASAADVCQAETTWRIVYYQQVELSVDESTATGSGCDELLPPDATQYDPQGVWTDYGPTPPRGSIFLVDRIGGDESGAVQILEHTFHVELHGTTADGRRTTAVFDGEGTFCGRDCYTATATGTWIGE